MSQSSNRFSALAGASSSKEQETSVPTTDDTDQTMQDASAAGSSSEKRPMSMSSLQDSLPEDRAALKDLFRKRLAAFDEEQQRKKSRTSSPEVVQQIPSAAPKPDDAMEVEQEFDFRSIKNPERNPKCAFKYQDVNGNTSAIIGDALGIASKGFSINLEVDGGRFGCPMLSMNVRINKGDKDAPVSNNSDDYYECKVTWRAGIAIEGLQVISNMQCSRMMGLTHGESSAYDQTIVDSCPEDRKHKLQQLVAIVFECSSAQLTPVEKDWFKGLSNEVRDGLHELFFGFGLHRMAIYFVAWPNAKAAYDNWCKHLEAAVNSNAPAFSQYLSADGSPNFSIQENEPISIFRKGMYAKYAVLRDARGRRIKNADGEFAEDKKTIVGYHRFSKKRVWETDYEFSLYGTIPVIRNTHFEMGQVAHLGSKAQLVHLQRMPALNTKDKDTGASSKYIPDDLDGSYRAFVRIMSSGATPPPHAKVRCEWDNSDISKGKPHTPAEDSKDVWWGRVMKGMEVACRATGTDFCVWFTKPARGTPPRTYKYADDEKFPDHQFVPAILHIKLDEMSSKREIDGMIKLAEPTIDERLAVPRMALMSDPSRLEHTVTNLTKDNLKVWRTHEKFCRQKYKGNKQQLEMALNLKQVKNRLTACIGPPGTGKTEVLADSVNASIMLGHKALVCAVSNNAVDKAANSCWEKFPETERSNYKFLRYETGSAELQSILTRPDFEDPSGGDPNARPEYQAPTVIEDDEVFMQTFDQAIRQEAEHDRTVRALLKVSKNLSVALEQKAEIDSQKKSNVASAMTLGNRMHELTARDTLEAVRDLEAELAAYRMDKQDEAFIEAVRKEGKAYRTEAALAALGMDKLDEAEIAARQHDGRIPSLEMRDKSFKYRSKLRRYRSRKGKLTREQKNEFTELRKDVVIRVFQETDVVFVTCNNAGSELVALGFSPKTIWIDETGQLTMAALANVLTSFTSWLVVTLFGDPNQLLPFVLAGRMNEFMANALLSVLALLEEKGYPVIRLIQQYRMAPAIVQWVAKFFYKGQLTNHASVLKDNKYREIARDISKRVYKIDGPEGNGSEYWMVDVANGLSQVQHHGTSLHNSANAEAIGALVDECLAKGVEPSEISVLVYYTGQLDVVIHKIEEKAQAGGRTWQFDVGRVSSVDAFQGEENEFVIIDVVVAHQRGQQTANQQDDNVDPNESDEEDSPDGGKSSGKVTSHVKSPNRLCCALTRGKNCVVVFCQLATIIGTAKAKQNKQNASISVMARDFIDRGLVYHDYDHLDTTPVSVEQRKAWDQAKLANERRAKQEDNMALLSTFQKSRRPARPATQDNTAHIYRTKDRQTTRPNMSGPAVDNAEKNDGRILATEAGDIPITTGGQTQHANKVTRKARRQEMEKEKEAKAAEDAKGKGKAIAAPAEDKAQGVTVPPAAPAEGKGKGKEKEKEDDTEMT